MPHDASIFLEDIRKAAQLILVFTAGRSLVDYSSDAMLHAAVERQFIIIGEALSQLEKLDPSLAGQITDYRKIIAFRNVLVHGYQAIDDQLVWLVISKDLPVLHQQVIRLLTGFASP